VENVDILWLKPAIRCSLGGVCHKRRLGRSRGRGVRVNWKLYDDQEADKFAFLVRIVADVFAVTPEQILCRSRFARWVEPRQLVATIWSENHSLQETGYRLDRHHGAIIHARERVRFLIEHDDRFADKVRECLQRLVNEAPMEEETPKEKTP
jgi:hypothetical protein